MEASGTVDIGWVPGFLSLARATGCLRLRVRSVPMRLPAPWYAIWLVRIPDWFSRNDIASCGLLKGVWRVSCCTMCTRSARPACCHSMAAGRAALFAVGAIWAVPIPALNVHCTVSPTTSAARNVTRAMNVSIGRGPDIRRAVDGDHPRAKGADVPLMTPVGRDSFDFSIAARHSRATS